MLTRSVHFELFLVPLLGSMLLLQAGCGGGDDGARDGNVFGATGGSPAGAGAPTGGALSTVGGSGVGGAPMTGGAPSTGAVAATGGTSTTTGGVAPTGGTMRTGGTMPTGGVVGATGGNPSTGGAPPLGGTFTGGSPPTGGVVTTGGASTGGDSPTGGVPATGGGGTSECGSSTPDTNPFGCDFAWGLGDPPTSLDGLGYLDFSTFWIDWGIAADGSFSSCFGCTWLTDKISGTDIVPVYYAYVIGYFAHANGVVDGNQCPADNPSCPNLTNEGAALIRANRDKLVGIYAEYARQSYAVWPTRPLVWLLEGDFIQFTEDSQSQPLAMDELAELAADITCAIKGNMPNAVVAVNHTTWNLNEETDAYWTAMNARVNYDLAWTTGVPDNSGYFNSDVNSGTYNAATANYAYLHSITGRPILVDDGCGSNADERWSQSPASRLNELIADGVIAFNHCDAERAEYSSRIEALRPQLDSTCN